MEIDSNTQICRKQLKKLAFDLYTCSIPTLSTNSGLSQDTDLDISPGLSCTSNDWGQLFTTGFSRSENFYYDEHYEPYIDCCIFNNYRSGGVPSSFRLPFSGSTATTIL